MPSSMPSGKAIRKAMPKPAKTRYRLILTCLNKTPDVISSQPVAAVLAGAGRMNLLHQPASTATYQKINIPRGMSRPFNHFIAGSSPNSYCRQRAFQSRVRIPGGCNLRGGRNPPYASSFHWIESAIVAPARAVLPANSMRSCQEAGKNPRRTRVFGFK